MSTLKTTNLQHASAASPAIVLASDSTATLNGLAYPTSGSLSGRNRIINGDMRIDQRNAGASVTPAGSTYAVDRWEAAEGLATGTLSGQQVSDAPSGFTNSLKFTTTASGTAGAAENAYVRQLIEGYNTADLAWGTASAAMITLSFWIKSSLTGTFSGGLFNNGADRSYVFTYSISAANTWEQKTVTISGDQSGTWNTTNARGIGVVFDLGSGSDKTGSAGSWTSSLKWKTSGSVSLIGTLNATWQITGVQLEAGSVATPFERRSYGQELSLCQRYCPTISYFGSGGDRFAGISSSTTASNPVIVLPVQPRTAPTGITVSSASHWSWFNKANNSGGTTTAITFSSAGANTVELGVTTTAGSPTIAIGNPGVLYPSSASALIIFTGCEL